MKKFSNILKKLYKKILKPYPRVPVVQLTGVIGNVGHFGRGLNLDSVEELLERAFDIPKIKAVALVINSPGGSPVQSELIHNKIRQLSEDKNVPVYTFAEDVAASGGYWILSSGDEIYASRNSIVGSIGVIAMGFGFVGAIKKLGIDRRVYTQGKNKSVLDPFQPEKKEDVELLKDNMADVHAAFIEQVKTRRGKKLKAKDDELFNGKFWTGMRAKQYGLVDEIGTLNEVLRKKFGKNVQILKLDRPKGFLRRTFGLLSSAELVDAVFAKIDEKVMTDQIYLK
jgi:signal peptide peptidase SppA